MALSWPPGGPRDVRPRTSLGLQVGLEMCDHARTSLGLQVGLGIVPLLVSRWTYRNVRLRPSHGLKMCLGMGDHGPLSIIKEVGIEAKCSVGPGVVVEAANCNK